MPEPEGDDVYLTIAQAVPYVNYVVTAYKIIDGMYNFGREDETDKAIRLLSERFAELEESVRALDERVSALEVRVAQTENRARLRAITGHLLDFGFQARYLASHPERAGDVASNVIARLRAMYDDDDLWMWSDILRKPDDAPDSWRPAAPAFKGVGLPTFAVGTTIWALAAAQHIASGAAIAVHQPDAAELLRWISTRTDWIPYATPPASIAERFRASIDVQIETITKWVPPSGICEFAFIAINRIDRTRTHIRNVDVYFGQLPNSMCMADPNIAIADEAQLEDETPYLKTLAILEDAVTRIQHHGTLADQFIGRFGEWTAHRLTLYAIQSSGELRRFQIETTTALAESPIIKQVGDVVGTGWQDFAEVFGTYDTVLYAFSKDGAVDWYSEVDVTRGALGWKGPQRVRPERGLLMVGEEFSYINGGSGTFFAIRSYTNVLVTTQSLQLMVHPDPANGTGVFRDSSVVASKWGGYPTMFGGGSGVFYGIDNSGDLYWHKHSSWPQPGTQIEGPVKIGNGWNGFSRVFAFGHGFIAGVYPNGNMLLYHFQQWRWGPQKETPKWHGPVRVPGSQWRGFSILVPMVGDEPAHIA